MPGIKDSIFASQFDGAKTKIAENTTGESSSVLGSLFDKFFSSIGGKIEVLPLGYKERIASNGASLLLGLCEAVLDGQALLKLPTVSMTEPQLIDILKKQFSEISDLEKNPEILINFLKESFPVALEEVRAMKKRIAKEVKKSGKAGTFAGNVSSEHPNKDILEMLLSRLEKMEESLEKSIEDINNIDTKNAFAEVISVLSGATGSPNALIREALGDVIRSANFISEVDFSKYGCHKDTTVANPPVWKTNVSLKDGTPTQAKSITEEQVKAFFKAEIEKALKDGQVPLLAIKETVIKHEKPYLGWFLEALNEVEGSLEKSDKSYNTQKELIGLSREQAEKARLVDFMMLEVVLKGTQKKYPYHVIAPGPYNKLCQSMVRVVQDKDNGKKPKPLNMATKLKVLRTCSAPQHYGMIQSPPNVFLEKEGKWYYTHPITKAEIEIKNYKEGDHVEIIWYDEAKIIEGVNQGIELAKSSGDKLYIAADAEVVLKGGKWVVKFANEEAPTYEEQIALIQANYVNSLNETKVEIAFIDNDEFVSKWFRGADHEGAVLGDNLSGDVLLDSTLAPLISLFYQKGKITGAEAGGGGTDPYNYEILKKSGITGHSPFDAIVALEKIYEGSEHDIDRFISAALVKARLKYFDEGGVRVPYDSMRFGSANIAGMQAEWEGIMAEFLKLVTLEESKGERDEIYKELGIEKKSQKEIESFIAKNIGADIYESFAEQAKVTAKLQLVLCDDKDGFGLLSKEESLSEYAKKLNAAWKEAIQPVNQRKLKLGANLSFSLPGFVDVDKITTDSLMGVLGSLKDAAELANSEEKTKQKAANDNSSILNLQKNNEIFENVCKSLQAISTEGFEDEISDSAAAMLMEMGVPALVKMGFDKGIEAADSEKLKLLMASPEFCQAMSDSFKKDGKRALKIGQIISNNDFEDVLDKTLDFLGGYEDLKRQKMVEV